MLSNAFALVREVRTLSYNDLEKFCRTLIYCDAERSLRGIAVGRRNWTFYGSDNGGRTAAVLTSLITTSKRLGLDPFAYLRDIFQRIGAIPRADWPNYCPRGAYIVF